MIPRVGFLPPTDPRVLGTIAAIQNWLTEDGFVKRYDTTDSGDGLTGGEGLFLACSFWLVDALHLAGQQHQATELFERLLALRKDVGLLSEEWAPTTGRQFGNTPQAFSTSPSSPAPCNNTPAKVITATTTSTRRRHDQLSAVPLSGRPVAVEDQHREGEPESTFISDVKGD